MKHIKSSLKKQETYHYNRESKINFPGPEGYNFGTGAGCLSPCMNIFWRKQPIREGEKKEE